MVDISDVKRLLVMVLVVCAACGGKAKLSTEPVSGSVKERNVSFKTSDGVRLTGRLFGSGRVGVTLAHMYPADASSWYPAARKLAEAGYLALAFNFRGYDGSEGPKVIPKAPDDVIAAKSFLKRSGAKQVVFIGASMGGTASLIAAATEDALAVVAISAPLNFMGLDAGGGIVSHVQRPTLLIASQDDPAGAFHSLEQFAQSLPNPVTQVYSGHAHGTDLLQARPGAVDLIIRFLRRWAPVKTPEPTA